MSSDGANSPAAGDPGQMPPRVRIAPSPTGDPHVGTAYIGLFNYVFARKHGGAFILRIEDTDRERSTESSERAILAALRWLGLTWDEGPDVGGAFGPYTQSERFNRYAAALEELLSRDLVYPCVCSRKDLSAAAALQEETSEEGPRYPGTCARRKLSEVGDQPYALRFRAADEVISFTDRVQGAFAHNVQELIGDFIVRRKDAVAAYQLAVVLDDIAMEITDVVRGADLLGSTPRQMLLYRALGATPPRYAHVPLMLSTSGEKFSKRERDVCVGSLQQAGRSATEIVGFLAHSAGLIERPESATPADLLPGFSLEGLKAADTRVDPLSQLR